MQLTQRIIDAIKDGLSSEFYDLLIQYGRWACYLGCSGYATGKQSQTAWIDDESALCLDAVFGRLKKAFPAVWQILRMYYVQDMDELDIVTMLKRAKKLRRTRQGVRRGRNYYGFDPAYAEVLCSVGPKEVLSIKKRGEEMIFNYLIEINQKDKRYKNEKL